MLKSRMVYLILLLCAIGFYIFYGKYIAFSALILVCSLPFFLYAITLFTSRKISVNFFACKTATQKDAPAEIQITVNNESMLHISCAKLTIITQNLFSSELSQTQLIFPINADQSTTIKSAVLSKYCGNIDVKLNKIKLYDFLGLTTHSKRLAHCHKLAVLPNVYEIASNAAISILSDDESHDFSSTKSGDNPSQVFDYHEYAEGDRVKNINWKLSTRLDRLMVKELSLPISSAACILFEFGDCKENANRLTQLDVQIETFTSISSWLFTKGISHEVEWYSPLDFCGVSMKLSGMENLFFLLEQIYIAKPHFGAVLLEEIASRKTMPQVSHMFYLTNTLDSGRVTSLLALKEMVELSVVCVKETEDALDSELLQALSTAEINYIEICSSEVGANLQNMSCDAVSN